MLPSGPTVTPALRASNPDDDEVGAKMVVNSAPVTASRTYSALSKCDATTSGVWTVAVAAADVTTWPWPSPTATRTLLAPAALMPSAWSCAHVRVGLAPTASPNVPSPLTSQV